MIFITFHNVFSHRTLKISGLYLTYDDDDMKTILNDFTLLQRFIASLLQWSANKTIYRKNTWKQQLKKNINLIWPENTIIDEHQSSEKVRNTRTGMEIISI